MSAPIDPLAIERENSIMPCVADLVAVEVEASEHPQRPYGDFVRKRAHAHVGDPAADAELCQLRQLILEKRDQHRETIVSDVVPNQMENCQLQ